MRAQLQSRAARQGGVFTRRDAVECGSREREMKTRTGHGGGWVVVRRGVYADRHLGNALDDNGRYLLGAGAVHLSLRADRALSHTTAAALRVTSGEGRRNRPLLRFRRPASAPWKVPDQDFTDMSAAVGRKLPLAVWCPA